MKNLVKNIKNLVVLAVFGGLFAHNFANAAESAGKNPTPRQNPVFATETTGENPAPSENPVLKMGSKVAELFDLANQIRGSSYECFGIEIYQPYARFSAQIENDYQKDALEPTADYAQKLEYFNYWRYQSADNYALYARFMRLSKQLCEQEREHFAQLAGSAAGGAHLCERFIERFGERAFGAIKPPYKRLDERYTHFLQLDGNDAIAYLGVNNFSEAELEFLLKIALLEHKDLPVIRFFIDMGAQLDSGYESAIFYALNYPAALKLLLANGADANYTNAFGKTALIYAAEAANLQAVRVLLHFGARVDIRQQNASEGLPFYMSNCGFKHVGKTALMAAAASADEAMLQLLIGAGAQADAQDAQGLKALDYALIYEHENNARYLQKIADEQSASGGRRGDASGYGSESGYGGYGAGENDERSKNE